MDISVSIKVPLFVVIPLVSVIVLYYGTRIALNISTARLRKSLTKAGNL